MQFFTELSLIILVLTFSFTALSGIGYLTSIIFKFNSDDFVSYYFFFGFAICLISLEIIHFFSPINIYISLIFLIIGIFAFLFTKGIYLRSLTKIKITLFPFIIFLLLSFFWILKSMDMITNLDSSIYHLSFIKWINEYHYVGGLGNLIINFANNQSWFFFISLLNFSPIIENGNSFAGLLILFVAVSLILHKRNNIPYSYVFLPIFLVTILFNNIDSPHLLLI